eukprot:scaffold84885_cov30-Tisochrysis_lutea.AAC.4
MGSSMSLAVSSPLFAGFSDSGRKRIDARGPPVPSVLLYVPASCHARRTKTGPAPRVRTNSCIIPAAVWMLALRARETSVTDKLKAVTWKRPRPAGPWYPSG